MRNHPPSLDITKFRKSQCAMDFQPAATRPRDEQLRVIRDLIIFREIPPRCAGAHVPVVRGSPNRNPTATSKSIVIPI
jgi:hypothetical protein